MGSLKGTHPLFVKETTGSETETFAWIAAKTGLQETGTIQ